MQKPTLNVHCRKLLLKHAINSAAISGTNGFNFSRFLLLGRNFLTTSRSTYTLGVLHQLETTTCNFRFCDHFNFLTTLGKRHGVEIASLQQIVSLFLPTKVSITLFGGRDTNIQRITDIFAGLNAKFCLHVINKPPDLPVLLNALGPKLRKIKCDPKLLGNDLILPMELDFYDTESNVTLDQLLPVFNCHKIKHIKMRTGLNSPFYKQLSTQQLDNFKSLKFVEIVCNGQFVHEMFEFLSRCDVRLTQLTFQMVTTTVSPNSVDDIINLVREQHEIYVGLKDSYKFMAEKLVFNVALPIFYSDSGNASFNGACVEKLMEAFAVCKHKLNRREHIFERQIISDFMELNLEVKLFV